jgi:hypothetical protein
MAFNYPKKDGDKCYRLVSVMNETIGPWMEFEGSNVEYPEQCVLEVEHADGTLTVEYERSVRMVSVGRDGNQLFFPKDIPVARMWARSGGMMYKVPAGLKERDGMIYMLIPGGAQSVIMGGDKYFNKVYALSIS